MKSFLVIFGVFFCSIPVLSDGVVFCYWGSWANERPSIGRYGVSDMPTDLCTHYVYSFIGLTPDADLTFPDENVLEGKSNIIKDFMGLKEQNSSLKLLVAIGGWLEGTTNFSIVSNNDTLRARLVSNLVTYIDEQGFDGLDLDWEYPAQRGGNETDKEAFIWLCRDLKTAFEPRGWLLTAAVPVTQDHIDISYDVPSMNELMDYINLMCYDLRNYLDPVTGSHASLYPQITGDVEDVLNVEAGVNVWLKNGADASKLVLGLPNYGRTFNLTSLDNVGIGAPINGPGEAGPYTEEAGFQSYYEICLKQAEEEWNITEVEGNYVYGNTGHFWIGYDNEDTIFAKGSYAAARGLAGIMYWAVDLDDFGPYCSNTTYPLIRKGIEGYRSSGNAVNTSISLITLLTSALFQYL